MIVNRQERFISRGGGIRGELKDTRGIRQSETSEAWRAYNRVSCKIYRFQKKLKVLDSCRNNKYPVG